MMRTLLLLAPCLIAVMPAQAQVGGMKVDASVDQEEPSPLLPQSAPVRVEPSGRVANSAVGQAGQRWTREQAVPGITPLSRIDSRIQNRVQSRIRNRIDRDYDPQANATSPFAVAGEETRNAGRSRRR